MSAAWEATGPESIGSLACGQGGISDNTRSEKCNSCSKQLSRR